MMEVIDVHKSLTRRVKGNQHIWLTWRNELHNEELPEKWCNLAWGLVGK